MERQVYQSTSEWDDPQKDRFKYNPVFLKDKHGIFKLIEIFLTISAFISVGSRFDFRDSGSGGWINFTLSLSLIISLFFFFGYLFNLIPFLPGPWAVIDFVCQCLLAFLILISMIVAAAFSPYSNAAIAAAVFCAFLSLCYLIETLMRFSVKREGDRMVITTHGVFRSSASGGAAFQRAPTEPSTDGYGMP
ncbi:hypothetical protein TcWFU_009151 [Taenia crassiceps]|uniref:MARVEL domain-containing protein n=1 Tax=Taenia crassiceps TaxID=6207 RepID=A0ABR4QC24_9CEST